MRETNVPTTFTYYHVEVEDHSLILAENTPAETFVDNIDAQLTDVLGDLNETSLSQPVHDHKNGKLDHKIKKAG